MISLLCDDVPIIIYSKSNQLGGHGNVNNTGEQKKTRKQGCLELSASPFPLFIRFDEAVRQDAGEFFR